MKSNIRHLVATSLVIAAVAPALTAYAAPDAQLPPEHAQGSVSYVTGGIGMDEATAFKQAAASYPLTLEFTRYAKPRDEFLSDIKVTIRDQAGKTLLDTVSGGPFLLVKLPPGEYRVSAERHGVAKTDDVRITAGKPARVFFEWR